MLYSQPPGYNATSSNKQSLGVLATPGLQSQPNSLGFSSISSPFNQSGSKPGTSSFSPPSFSIPSSSTISPMGSTPSLNQYFGSRNISSLLRALVGNTTTNTSKL